MSDEFKGVTIALLTASTFASWSVEMEALLRAKGLWKCTQVLDQDFWWHLELSLSRRKTRSRPSSTKHSELFNVSSIQLARRLLEEALLPKTSVRHSRISWKARILYQDLFTDPSLHNQGRRRISWRRWLRQVSGGRHLEKTKWGQSETSWGARSPHDADRSSSIFRDQKKNSGISKGHCHKDYQERHTTRSF